MHRILLILLLLAIIPPSLPGCATNASLGDAYDAYEQGEYGDAYRSATQVVRRARGNERLEAAYVAGLSAQRLKRPTDAQRYLGLAARSRRPKVAGEALASLGLLHHEQGRYDRAARALLESAPLLVGDDRARSYFHAARAQQKLGRWSAAWTNMTMAQSLARDPALLRQIAAEKRHTGWTVQTGAFEVEAHARRELERVNRRAAGLSLGRPRLVRASRGGRTLHLVQIGHFSSYATALKGRDRLRMVSAQPVPLTSLSRLN